MAKYNTLSKVINLIYGIPELIKPTIRGKRTAFIIRRMEYHLPLLCFIRVKRQVITANICIPIELKATA